MTSKWVYRLPNMNGIPLLRKKTGVTPEKKGPFCCQDGTMPWKNEAFLGLPHLPPTFQPTKIRYGNFGNHPVVLTRQMATHGAGTCFHAGEATT